MKDNSEFDGPGILVIWGGSDIHPSYYNRPDIKSWVGNGPSQRDQTEAKLFAKAVKAGIPILGICRGAQLGCAMSGGILIQDVTGHGHQHRVTTVTDEVLVSSSLHHQMMYPWDIEHKLLAWATIPHSEAYIGLTEEELARIPMKKYPEFEEPQPVEPEVVLFPTTKCLAVQGHPEYMDAHHPFNQYVKGLIDAHLFS